MHTFINILITILFLVNPFICYLLIAKSAIDNKLALYFICFIVSTFFGRSLSGIYTGEIVAILLLIGMGTWLVILNISYKKKAS